MQSKSKRGRLTAWKASQREQVLLLVAGFLLIGFGAEHLIRSTYLVRKQQVKSEIQQLERRLARNQRLEAEADLIRQEYETVRNRSTMRSQAASESALLRAIERTAKGKIQLLSVNPLPGKRSQSLDEAFVAFQFSGGLSEIGKFVLALSVELGGDFVSLALSTGSTKDQTIECQATCTFVLNKEPGA